MAEQRPLGSNPVEGRIMRARSGFYDVLTEKGVVRCRARGRFRKDGFSPLAGDLVTFRPADENTGYIDAILPRKNCFVRPAVANIDMLVLLAAAVNPVTDPFLVDRVAVIAEHVRCGVVICINKCDLDRGEFFDEAFPGNTGYPLIRTSAVTGEGIDTLKAVLNGKTAVFTGNSGVGKSSLLNAISPGLSIPVGDVSDRLGRGRHTTRHIEFYEAGKGTLIADTPGFSSFDLAQMQPIPKQELQHLFPEFRPFLGSCRFDDCAHLKEPGCAVLAAVHRKEISQSRHDSYQRLYSISAGFREWEELKKNMK